MDTFEEVVAGAPSPAPTYARNQLEGHSTRDTSPASLVGEERTSTHISIHIRGSRQRNAPDGRQYQGGSARADAPNYAIMCLDKQTRDEVLQAGWAGTWKHFTGLLDLSDVLGTSNPPSDYDWLNRIHLNFSIAEYLRLFGVIIDPFVHIQPSRNQGPLLQGISIIKHLELFFQDPYLSGTNPWGVFYYVNLFKSWFKEDEKYFRMEQTPCQKTVVDWILTFAFPYIKGIPNIHLVGSIKTSTKKKWYHILEREYLELKYDYRTHDYDHALELANILGTPTYA
jgi:hypothetical protein